MATRVKFSELELAFDYVSFQSFPEHLAYVRKDTGEILWGSDDLDEEEELPEDIDDKEKYIAIPGKHDLDLGKSLVFDFVREFLPDDLDQVRRYFSRRGAYGNFKDLLAQRGAIDQWHKFENEAAERALREWCSENSIELIEDSNVPGPGCGMQLLGEVKNGIPMKLHWSPRSPFVRKVMIAAHETGLIDRLTCVRTVVAMTAPNADLLPDNPLSKIPTLVLDDGSPLYDSAVICEYLDTLHDGPKLFPSDPKARWIALRRHALGNGLLDLLILWRDERGRTASSQPYLDAYAVKYKAALNALEEEAPAIAATPFGIGHIAVGCALSYADFRFADLDWRSGHPQLAAWHKSFSQRPSARATEAVEG